MIINIAEIKNKKIKAQKIEFENDKDYIEIPLMNNNEKYNRAKSKNLTNRLIEEQEKNDAKSDNNNSR